MGLQKDDKQLGKSLWLVARHPSSQRKSSSLSCCVEGLPYYNTTYGERYNSKRSNFG